MRRVIVGASEKSVKIEDNASMRICGSGTFFEMKGAQHKMVFSISGSVCTKDFLDSEVDILTQEKLRNHFSAVMGNHLPNLLEFVPFQNELERFPKGEDSET